MSCNLNHHIQLIESSDFTNAKNIQSNLANKVVIQDNFNPITTVAGLDVGFKDNNTIAFGGIVVLSYPQLDVLASSSCSRKVVFPYVPGFLSFREVPVLLQAYEKLSIKPDLLICDGQGIAHPRGFGLACHLGIVLNLPSIGAAKSRLIGDFSEPGPTKGSGSNLLIKNHLVGKVVRTRTNTQPLFISPGHNISIDTGVEITLSCCPKFRLPETTRQAHKLVSG